MTPTVQQTTAADLLLQAEQEINVGRYEEASRCLEEVAGMRNLSPVDRARFELLSQTPRIMVVRGAQPSAGSDAPMTAQDVARQKLKQARLELAEFKLDEAERLAHEAEVANVAWQRNEESPRKVLEEVARVRADGNSLLAGARHWLAKKDYNRAENLALLADKVGIGWTINPFADTPAKALKDIRAEREKTGQKNTAQQPPAPASIRNPTPGASGQTNQTGAGQTTQRQTTTDVKPAAAPTKTPAQKLEEARTLVAQGRKALQAGDLKTARALGEQARALRADFNYTDDYPERFLADVTRAERAVAGTPATTPAGATAASTTSKPTVMSKEQAVVQLQNGRKLLADNKVDEALDISLRLKAQQTIKWGLFEDSPEALFRDASAVKTQRNQEMAGRLLVEARQLFAKGDLKGAESAAQRAQQLHGAYSVFDFGDRPTKLLAEIDAARVKQKSLPTNNPTQLAQKTPDNKPTTPPTAGNPVAQCQSLMAEARLALSQGDASKAYNLAKQAKELKQRYNLNLADSPEVVLAEAERAAGVRPQNVQTVGAPVNQVDPIAQLTRQQAGTLLATARAFEKQGKLIEARQKAQEASALKVSFGPNEDSPDVALQQINARAAQTVGSLVKGASETLATGRGNPAEIAAKAETSLTQARLLAVAFGLDTQPIETQMVVVERLRGGPGAAGLASGYVPPGMQQGTLPGGPAQLPGPLPGPQPGPQPGQLAGPLPGAPGQLPGALVSQPGGQGQMLLDSARMELRKGELSTARKMAEEAYRGPFGVQDDAVKILRSIDAEEARQRGLMANRTFDAAKQAYQRGDYQVASNLLVNIDVRQLDPERQGRLRELMMTPQLQPPTQVARNTPTVTPIPTVPGTTGTQTVGNQQTTVDPAAPNAPGRQVASDMQSQPQPPQPGILETTAAMREVKFQAIRAEGLKAQSEATERFRSGQVEQALEMLQNYLNVLNDSGLEANQTALLRRPVESRLKQFSMLKEQQELMQRNETQKENKHAAIGREQMAQTAKHKKVEELMKQFTAYYKEGKYLDAERVAMQAHELDPDNAIVAAAMTMAKRQRQVEEFHTLKDNKAELFLAAMNETDIEGDPAIIKNHQTFDPEIWKTASKRKDRSMGRVGKSAKEREIENKLNTPVTLNFKDVPLYAVLDDIRAYHGINIWVDKNALESKGISLDRPVEIKMEGVALKTCMNLLLKNVGLTYVIREEVLQITTPEAARGKQETRTFLVTDLIIPVLDFDKLKTVQNGNVPNGFRQDGGMSYNLTATPLQTPYSLLGGTNVGTPTGTPTEGTSIQKSNSPTQEDQLIKLITNTIEPKSWESMGGPGTIQFFPLTNTLVINQTTDIQEQIADLLQALRRLQDQEVAVEIRFITITEDFYERIGVNFQMNIANPEGQRFAPNLITSNGNSGVPLSFNSFVPSHLVSGLTPAGTLTPDLSVPIRNNSFFEAIPQFGGYAPGVGGIQMGLAFLSDIQVFLFLEAVQGDTRSNVMMAPKLTLFNGQTATLNVAQSQVNYVSGVTLQSLGNGQFAFVPQTQVLPIQANNLTIQAVITADRRFVRMSLNPTLVNQIPGPVNTFPITVPLFTGPQGPSAFAGPSDPVILTQYIQQPATTVVGIGTTVMVPDGGTVLLGGLKYLSESRTEFGPPLLGKIPVLDRLFRNVGYGRTTGSLLIMVTPRIIIQEEEEERATGFISRPLIGAGGPVR
jgi:type II secretory pathway component GspD/PulD (secretin)